MPCGIRTQVNMETVALGAYPVTQSIQNWSDFLSTLLCLNHPETIRGILSIGHLLLQNGTAEADPRASHRHLHLTQ